MAHTHNSDTDTQDAAQEIIATIVAQGRTKKASTQKRKGKSTKVVQVPRVEHEEGVEHDDPVPQDLVPPPTAVPAQTAISLEVGQMFNVANSAMEMFKAFMANQNDSIADEVPMMWLEGVKKALRAMKAFNDEAVELATYQLRDLAEEDREAKSIKLEQLKKGNKNMQEYYMEFIRLAKHTPYMVKTEKAKIRRFIGILAYHIKEMISASAVGMIAFSSVAGFTKHLEKDRQQMREEKEQNKKARTADMFNGTSSGGGRGSFNKESLSPALSIHQSGGGSSFRRQCKLGFHGCYHCGDINHIKANCPKLRRNFSGVSTRPSSSSATTVAPP
uniref:CCHC-type domain-containing protein n=2 Tax=Nicotiana TaxID=4085 RepID=A0A1S4CDM9_TOBAC|nr:PREDICTED: uncharacterized protein LOC104211143 [Nicotiana sylvestris]XP_016499216.1 PREDICTED: uncharacterized protein LOC107817839 [Nicotiana tabacum]